MSINLNYTHFSISKISVYGESGAPVINGSTNSHWYIESSDTITRTNEYITTKEITLNNTGIMTWENVTAEINGNIQIKSDAEFNLINSTLTLNGNLSVYGRLYTLNTTIRINCTVMGEFFISAESGGEINLTSKTNIIGASNTQRIRTFWVDENSKLSADDCRFSFIGYNPKFSGVLVDSDNLMLRDCLISYCHYGLTLSQNHNGTIDSCELFECNIGLNLSFSNNNTISNCKIYNNSQGIIGYHSSQNLIKNSNIFNNMGSGIQFSSISGNNTIDNCSISTNNNSGIKFENLSSNNQITKCIIKNNNPSGIFINGNSNQIKVSNCTIANNNNGFTCVNISEDIELINSSIKSSKFFDCYVDLYSKLRLLNTSFAADKVQVDPTSNLTVQWFLHIVVQNSTYIPIPYANISIKDNDNGSYELSTITDEDGWLQWVVCTEFIETNSSRVYFTPHNISARKFGFRGNTTFITINSSTTINLSLNRTIPYLPDLIPISLTFSNQYPRQNQTIKIATVIWNRGLLGFDNNNSNVSIGFYVDDKLINLSSNLTSIQVNKGISHEINWTINVTNGTHSIRIQVDIFENLTEVNETNNSLSKNIIINSIPIAILKVEPQETLTFKEILFNASKSYNEVESIPIQMYYYTFGDGKTSGWITNSTVLYNYPNNGIYFVMVKVLDASNNESQWSTLTEIIINNRAPEPSFTIEPSAGTVETEFTFNPALSSDLDGNIVSYLWNFSDGINSTDPAPKHTFDDDIVYNISLTVWDDDGTKSQKIMKQLRIQNLPPDATFNYSPRSPNSTEKITFNSTGTFDLDDELITLDYIWDFGDGSNFVFNDTIVQHNYSKPGLYNVTLWVIDDDGESGKVVLQILINETVVPPPKEPADSDMFWVVGLIVIVLIIFMILIMLVFYTQSKRLRGQITDESSLVDDEGKIKEFSTAGKLDFVILKRPIGKRYIKFELHKTTESPAEYLGLTWKSALFDKSWVLLEKQLDSRDKIIDYLQLKILAYNSKNWAVDYSGNGSILTGKATSIPIKSTGIIGASSKPSDSDGKKPEPDEDKI
jgi:parallel beta-helix repeat protein